MTERRDARGLLYALPAIAVYLPLIAVSLGYTMYLSLCRPSAYGRDWPWVGLGNYAELLHDGLFWKCLGHNLFLIAFSLLVQLPLALFLAVLLSRASRLLSFVRTGIFLPYLLPTVVIALVGGLLFQRLPHNPFAEASGLTLPALCAVVSWRFVGFHMVLYLAGLSTIDPRLYDAARVDGAGPWAILRHVTLPLLAPVITVSVVLSVVGAVKYFDIVYVMTGGGPPPHATELVATQMYALAIDLGDRGYASAYAIALVAFSFAGLGAVLLTARLIGGLSRRPERAP